MELLRDMALFVEVARAKSFIRAAESLGMPNSSVSRRITELEKAIGLRLLNRTTRKVELTEAGVVYLSRAQQIVEAAKLAHEQLQDMAQTPRGNLRISMPVDFSTVFLTPLIAEFARRYPAINFDLELSERRVDMLSENFDLAIRLGEQPDSTLTARRIAFIEYGLYASPDYLRARGELHHPSELSHHTCIRMVCPHWDSNWRLTRGEERVAAPVAHRFAMNNIGMVLRFATLGLGIAALDEVLAQDDFRAGRLRRLLPDWNFAPVPVFGLTPTRMLPAKTRIFLDFLAEQMGGVSVSARAGAFGQNS